MHFFSQKYMFETLSHVKSSGEKLRFFRDFVLLFFDTQVLVLVHKKNCYQSLSTFFNCICKYQSASLCSDIGCQYGGFILFYGGKQKQYNKVAQNNLTPVCLSLSLSPFAIIIVFLMQPRYFQFSLSFRCWSEWRKWQVTTISELQRLHDVSFS